MLYIRAVFRDNERNLKTKNQHKYIFNGYIQYTTSNETKNKY